MDSKNDHSAYVIFLVHGTQENGDAFYAYLKIPLEKFAEFKSMYDAKAAFMLEDYGEILHWDKGVPTQEIRDRMEREHNMNHELENNIRSEFEKFASSYDEPKADS